VWYIFDDMENPYLAGGGARVVKEVVDRLSCRYDFTVIHGAYRGAFRQRRRGTLFCPVGLSWSPLVARITYMLAATWHSLRVRADVLFFGFSAYSPVLGFVPRWRRSVMLFYHELHGSAKRKYGIWGGFPGAMERLALVWPTRYLVLTEWMRIRIIKAREGYDTYIGVAAPGIDNLNLTAAFCEHHEDFVLYWGRLDVHQKGLDVLLDAWALMMHHRARLVIAGHGSGRDADWLRDRLNSTWDLVELGRGDVIQFSTIGKRYGIDAEMEIRRYLFTHAAVAVYPSRYEGFCIAALEAQAYGVPVVASSIPGLDEAVQHGVSGLLFTAEDAGDLAGTLSWLLDSEQSEKRRELARGGRNHAARYTWDACADVHQNMIENVLSRQMP
jgi:glycosyltransferase involved in cell wall biosynthesis